MPHGPGHGPPHEPPEANWYFNYEGELQPDDFGELLEQIGSLLKETGKIQISTDDVDLNINQSGWTEFRGEKTPHNTEHLHLTFEWGGSHPGGGSIEDLLEHLRN